MCVVIGSRVKITPAGMNATFMIAEIYLLRCLFGLAWIVMYQHGRSADLYCSFEARSSRAASQKPTLGLLYPSPAQDTGSV